MMTVIAGPTTWQLPGKDVLPIYTYHVCTKYVYLTWRIFQMTKRWKYEQKLHVKFNMISIQFIYQQRPFKEKQEDCTNRTEIKKKSQGTQMTVSYELHVIKNKSPYDCRL